MIMRIKGALISIIMLCLASNVKAQVNFIYHNYSIPNAMANNLEISHVATGDFNGDGKADVITAGTYPPDATSHFFYIFLSNAADSLNATPVIVPYYSPSTGRHVSAMEVTDMNNDNLSDVITGLGDSIYIYYQTSLHGLRLSPIRHYAGQQVNAIRVADIDSDGYKDIVVSLSQETYLAVFYGTGTTDSFVQVQYAAPQFSGSDLKIAPTGHRTRASVLRQCNLGNGLVFTETRILPNRQLDTTIFYQLPGATSTISGVAAGDRYGDGNNQLLATINHTFKTWRYPDLSSIADTSATVTRPADDILMYDLDCDGKDEIIIGAAADDAISVISPNGREQIFYAYIPNGMAYDDMTVANVIGDDKADIVAANTYGGVTVLENISAATDSFDLASTQIQYDSSYFDSSFYTGYMQNVVYIGADTVITEIETLHLYATYNFNILRTTFTGKGYRRCLGDTVNFYSVSESVLNYSYTYDTVVAGIQFDTSIIFGLHNLSLQQVNLYPNPATNTLFIKTENIQPVSTTVYDADGRLIYAMPFKPEIDINALSSGVYFVEVKSNEGVARKRFVKM